MIFIQGYFRIREFIECDLYGGSGEITSIELPLKTATIDPLRHFS